MVLYRLLQLKKVFRSVNRKRALANVVFGITSDAVHISSCKFLQAPKDPQNTDLTEEEKQNVDLFIRNTPSVVNIANIGLPIPSNPSHVAFLGVCILDFSAASCLPNICILQAKLVLVL